MKMKSTVLLILGLMSVISHAQTSSERSHYWGVEGGFSSNKAEISGNGHHFEYAASAVRGYWGKEIADGMRIETGYFYQLRADGKPTKPHANVKTRLKNTVHAFDLILLVQPMATVPGLTFRTGGTVIRMNSVLSGLEVPDKTNYSYKYVDTTLGYIAGVGYEYDAPGNIIFTLGYTRYQSFESKVSAFAFDVFTFGVKKKF